MGSADSVATLRIRQAGAEDVSLVLEFIRELAAYEHLSHEVTATEELLRRSLFGERRVAEVLLGYYGDEPASFAVFFQNFSTFLALPGIYLEDLYVRPHLRRKGIGAAMLRHLACLAKERGCGRLEWSVLNWNETALSFYRKLGAVALDDWTTYRVSGERLERLASP